MAARRRATDRCHKPVGVVGFGAAVKCVVPKCSEAAREGEDQDRARPLPGRQDHAGRLDELEERTVVGQSPRPYKRLKNGAMVKLRVSRGA